MILMIGTLHPLGIPIAVDKMMVEMVIAIVSAPALGWMVACIVLVPIFVPIAVRIQGGPFKAGDDVWILSGKHKNVRTRVYEVWHERGEVRVDLGSQAKESCDDVFDDYAVCRARPDDAVSDEAPG